MTESAFMTLAIRYPLCIGKDAFERPLGRGLLEVSTD